MKVDKDKDSDLDGHIKSLEIFFGNQKKYYENEDDIAFKLRIDEEQEKLKNELERNPLFGIF